MMMLLLSLLAGGILARFAKAVLFPAGATTSPAGQATDPMRVL